jgi:hypothetical protein
MTEVTQQPQGNVTLEDVRAALAGTDPNQTNAGAIRAILGRGSNKTIQTHLDKIRAELMPQPLQATGEAPTAPKELVQSLWSSAWQSAQLQTAGALASALAKLDVTEHQLVTARADADAAQSAADVAVAVLAEEQEKGKKALEEANTEKEALEKALAEVRAKAEEAAKTAASELATAKAAADLAQERAAAALALAEAKHQAAQESLRSEMDRLIQQLADLRSALSARPPVAKAAEDI